MDREKLTQKVVNNALCPEGKRFGYIMDATLPGFGVQVTSTGAKSYIIRFQHKGRRECRTFAPVESMTLTAARTRARELIGEYLKGGDPLKVETKKKRAESGLFDSQERRREGGSRKGNFAEENGAKIIRQKDCR